jgi:hypothetical protein
MRRIYSCSAQHDVNEMPHSLRKLSCDMVRIQTTSAHIPVARRWSNVLLLTHRPSLPICKRMHFATPKPAALCITQRLLHKPEQPHATLPTTDQIPLAKLPCVEECAHKRNGVAFQQHAALLGTPHGKACTRSPSSLTPEIDSNRSLPIT